MRRFVEWLLNINIVSNRYYSIDSKRVLADLLVDEDKVTDELVRELLLPYVGLSKAEDKIIPKPEFTVLAYPQRVLLYLLARHAMARLKIPGGSLAANPEKITMGCLVPKKSCGETLSRLKAAGLVEKDKDGYLIPVHSLLRVAAEIRNAGKAKQKH